MLPHIGEIEQYLRQYFGVPELASAPTAADDPLGEASLAERAPNQPPLVGAGIDQTLKLDGSLVATTLEGSVSDDRINQADALFVTWEKIGGDGAVTFTERHALQTKATFLKRGVYALRLTASDGQLFATDTMIVTVNEPPTINILAPTEPQRKRDNNGKSFWEVELQTEVTTGLGDPKAPLESVEWSEVKNVAFANRKTTNTKITFTKSGSYLLTLTIDNGSFTRDAQVVIEVAARVKEQLQVLYTFEEGAGDSVIDVSGSPSRLNLAFNNLATTTQRVTGGLALQNPTILTTRDPLADLTSALQAANEITLEAWLKPKTTKGAGMRRIVTFSNGPAARNFTLGQRNGNYYVALRTTAPNTNNGGAPLTDLNASHKALAGGAVSPDLSHVVCTRDKAGLTVLYINGIEVARRFVSGDFSGWDNSFTLALGNELNANDGHDRAWLGEYHLLAIYSRALRQEEIQQNFQFGADAKLPPQVFAGTDRAIKRPERGRQPLTLALEGRITPDRPTTGMIVTWMPVAGPKHPTGVTFANASAPNTTATFAEEGRYLLRLQVEDGEFMASDELVVVVEPAPLSLHKALMDAEISVNTEELLQARSSLLAAGVAYRWEQTSGPGSMKIAQADQLNTALQFTERGVYKLTLIATQNGRLWDSVSVHITVHQPPVLQVATTQLITLPVNTLALPKATAVTDSGLATARSKLLFTWEPINVPGTPKVELQDEADSTTATFPAGGVYKLRLTATNPNLASLSTSAEVTVTVNQLPVVEIDALPQQPILIPEAVLLEATVSDDGLPNPEVSLQWLATGPGQVFFTDPTAVVTTATFTTKGVYELQLTAHDGDNTGSDSKQVTVQGPPTVLVSQPFLNPRRSEGAFLTAILVDDGLVEPQPGQITTEWKQTSGPAATMASANSLSTFVSFANRGNHTFELTVTNGLRTATDEPVKATVTVTVAVR